MSTARPLSAREVEVARRAVDATVAEVLSVLSIASNVYDKMPIACGVQAKTVDLLREMIVLRMTAIDVVRKL